MMIKQALKGKKSKSTKKKAKKSDVNKKAEKLDSISRFFNDYGESPHL